MRAEFELCYHTAPACYLICGGLVSSTSTTGLELEDLVLAVSQVLEGTIKLSLVARADLSARDGLVHCRWSTDEDLDVLLLRLRQYFLQEFLGDISLLEARRVLRRVVEHVEGAEALRVRVLEVVELALEQDVVLGDVAEDERHLGLVVGVVEDGARELVHRRDAGAAGEEGDVLVLVGVPCVLGDGALELDALAGLDVVQVRGHGAVGVFLDEEREVASLVCTCVSDILLHTTVQGSEMLTLIADWRIWAYDEFFLPWSLVPGQQRRCDLEAAHVVFAWQSECEFLGVMIDRLDLVQLQADPVSGESWRRWSPELLCNGLLDLVGIWSLAVVVVSTSTGRSCDSGVHKSVGGARCARCSLSGIAAVLLEACQYVFILLIRQDALNIQLLMAAEQL